MANRGPAARGARRGPVGSGVATVEAVGAADADAAGIGFGGVLDSQAKTPSEKHTSQEAEGGAI